VVAEPSEIEAIYYAALERTSGPERSAYLDSVCRDDSATRARVEALLRANEEAGDFLETSLVDPAVSLDGATLTEGPGTIIGRYKLLQRIGEGGMAVVYMAEQAEPIRRKVALKIIKLGMDTSQVIARFEAERQALAMMDHPNIARVLDAGATETGRPYFVMELVTGVSITEYCDQNNLSTKDRLALFIQVCNAVQHAHQKGIIHRDIKPSNVLVTQRDGRAVPKVIDFGIAKATNQRLTEKTLFTRYAHIIGTPAYMSPEQAELSDLDVDTRSDIYSLGVLLHELLTGTTPFSAEELRNAGYVEMQRVIREEEPAKPSTKLTTLGETLTDIATRRGCTPDLLTKTVRGDLDWIVMKTLEKDRTRRYDSTSALQEDIKRHLNHEPVSAGPPGAWYRTKKLLQRNGKLAATLATIVGVVAAGFVVSTAMYLQAKRAHEEADTARAEAISVADFLTNDLLASVHPERAKGPEVTVRYILESASENLEEKFANSPLTEAKVRDALGLTYQKMGKYQEAEPHLERALAIRRAQLGGEDPATLASVDRLGWLYWHQGRYDEGRALVAEALELRRCVLGAEHADTLASLVHSASLATHDREAITLAEEAYGQASRVLGEDHPTTLRAAHGLAMGYLVNRRGSEAAAIVPRNYELSRRVLGDEHETTIGLMTALSWVYRTHKRYDDGVALAKQALETALRVVGEESVPTIYAMNNLGWLYLGQRRFDLADAPLNRSVEIARRFLGEEHELTLCCSLRLGILLRRQGKLEEHERLITDSLEICRRLYGDDYPLTKYFEYWLELRAEELAKRAEEQTASGGLEGAAATEARLQEINQALQGH
jgi:serine/threonine protein kinase